jgi:phage-related protein (TIGR01555 family)
LSNFKNARFELDIRKNILSRKSKKILKNSLQNNIPKDHSIYTNNLTSFTKTMSDSNGPQNMKLDTMIRGLRYGYISLFRQVLAKAYIQHGLIQKLISQPVDDAFKGGIKIKTDSLDSEDSKHLDAYIEHNNIIDKIKETIKWGRLFGGSGLVINASQKADEEFDINKINEKSRLDFYPADMWELNMAYYEINPSVELKRDIPYMFYGERLHQSRVLRFIGRQAPSIFRRQFRGWGMSEVERLVASFNQFLKNNEVGFELMDECKVDVFSIEGYKNALMSPDGEEMIKKQVQLTNMLKSFLNAVVMDTTDKFEQKTMSFAGVSDMMKENRMILASDLNMPITKLFGISASGFNAGDDDLENYNSMLESEIRDKARHLIYQTYRIIIKHLFDVVVDDLQIEFEPLRILTAEQEESVKNQKLERLLRLVDAGLVDIKTAKECINVENLIAKDVDVDEVLFKDMNIGRDNEGF